MICEALNCINLIKKMIRINAGGGNKSYTTANTNGLCAERNVADYRDFAGAAHWQSDADKLR